MENVRRRANGGALAVIIAAVAFALAVLFAGAFGTPVKAEEGDVQTTPIDVQLTVPKGVNVPVNATISINAVADNKGVSSITATGNTTLPVYSSGGPTVHISDVVFDNSQNAKEENKAGNFADDNYKKQATVNVSSLENVRPGVYHYTVTATAENQDGLSITSGGKIDMYLYVYAKDNSKSAEVVYFDRTGEEATAVRFDDHNAQNKSNGVKAKYETTTLEVKKIARGNIANLNSGDKFEFDFEVTNPNNAKQMLYIVTNTRNNEENNRLPVEIEANQTKKFTVGLSHLESVKIYGITAHDSITYKEKDYSSNGFTTEYYNGDITSPDEHALIDLVNGKVLVSTDKDVYNTVINTSNTTTPTDLIYNPMTYIILIAAAAVLGTLLYRRKHAYDDED